MEHFEKSTADWESIETLIVRCKEFIDAIDTYDKSEENHQQLWKKYNAMSDALKEVFNTPYGKEVFGELNIV